MLKSNMKAYSVNLKELESLTEGHRGVRYVKPESDRVTELYRERARNVKQAGERQLAALLVSRVATSVPLKLVSSHTAEFITRGTRDRSCRPLSPSFHDVNNDVL